MAATTGKLTLEKEYKYLESNKKSLISKYSNQWVVIKGEEVLGSFPSQDEAYAHGLEQVGNEPFLIEQIRSSEELTEPQQVTNNANSRSI